MPFSCPSVGPFHALSVGSTLGPLCGKERAPMQGRTQRSSPHVCHLRRSHYQTSPEISRLDLVCHLYSPCIACTSQPMFLDGARPFASLSLARRAEVLLRPARWGIEGLTPREAFNSWYAAGGVDGAGTKHVQQCKWSPTKCNKLCPLWT